MIKVKIMLIGDSISMGYRENVRDLLVNECEVLFPSENGKFAAHTYRMLWEWKDELQTKDDIEVIYWNNGLWDVVRIYGDEAQTPIQEYERYLMRIQKRMRTMYPRAKIIFALTTPVMEEKYGRDFYRLNRDIEQYNLSALNTLRDSVDAIDDLYKFVKESSLLREYRDATHFNDNANLIIANHIAKMIRTTMPVKIDRKQAQKEIAQMKLVANHIMNNNLPVVLWGTGKCFDDYVDILKSQFIIKAVVDSNTQKHGEFFHGIRCIAPNQAKSLAEDIIIMLYEDNFINEVIEQCMQIHMRYSKYNFFLEEIIPQLERTRLREMYPNDMPNRDPYCKDVMRKYIGINVPVYECNFKCTYCYLAQTGKAASGIPRYPHDPKYLRSMLSRDRVGGSALIGICGYGETLLCDKISEICKELLEEGHYLHIVTNGAIKKYIKEIILKAGDYAGHVMFKVSFHYLELKRRKMLERFAENMKIIESSPCSYTIELMPHDELIPYVEDIKKYSIKNFGAYPQLTIGRDELNGRQLLTRYTKEEYYKIWKVFDSEMFDARMEMYMMHGYNCRAGRDAFFIDLFTGDVSRCIFKEKVGNIYDISKSIDYEMVNNSCPMDYCYNCHVYGTLGLMPDCSVPTYFKIRDRKRIDGSHWIKKDMQRFIDIKLFDVNHTINEDLTIKGKIK